jgi:hypothetical protein
VRGAPSRSSLAIRRDFLETPAITSQLRRLSGECLPALDRYIDGLRKQLKGVAGRPVIGLYRTFSAGQPELV